MQYHAINVNRWTIAINTGPKGKMWNPFHYIECKNCHSVGNISWLMVHSRTLNSMVLVSIHRYYIQKLLDFVNCALNHQP